jgi:hypothetical protein
VRHEQLQRDEHDTEADVDGDDHGRREQAEALDTREDYPRTASTASPRTNANHTAAFVNRAEGPSITPRPAERRFDERASRRGCRSSASVRCCSGATTSATACEYTCEPEDDAGDYDRNGFACVMGKPWPADDDREDDDGAAEEAAEPPPWRTGRRCSYGDADRRASDPDRCDEKDDAADCEQRNA